MPSLARQAAPTSLSKQGYETKYASHVKVHIAGKGNLPTAPVDAETAQRVYAQYRANWSRDQSFHEQTKVFAMLKGHVERDFVYFHSLMKAEFGGKLVFTFDGDNLCDSSPFTVGLRCLISDGAEVIAFRANPPSQRHEDSWIGSPYAGLVVLGEGLEPSNYTGPACHVYLSYAMPLMLDINQPQKDCEIVTDASGSKTDRYDRRMVDSTRPGLVVPSVRSEFERLSSRFHRMDHDFKERGSIFVRYRVGEE